MEQRSKNKNFLEQYIKVLYQILLKSNSEELSSVIFGYDENGKNIIVMYYKNYIILYSEIFKEKMLSVNKNALNKYSYLKDKGINYLNVEFIKNQKYNLKIKVEDVKVPKYKLKRDILNVNEDISKYFTKGKINFNAIDNGENEQNQGSESKSMIFYILIFIGIIDLIFTIIILAYAIFINK